MERLSVYYKDDTSSNNTSTIDTFLLSCRIIGRNAEYAFMNFIISHLKKKKINLVKSNYIRSSKNKQVENFYEQCLFEMEKDKKEEKSYSVKINKYKPKLINYIQINE